MKKETLRQKEAFEYYYLLEKRSIPRVAQKYSVSVPCVKKWSKNFEWQKRTQERDIVNGKKLSDKTDMSVVNKKAEMLKIVNSCLEQFKRKLKRRKVVIGNVQDLEKLIRSAMLLMGEKTSNPFDLKDIMEFLKGDKPS